MTYPLSIIILDDEPKMGRILARILAREGHRVQSYTEPQEALDALAQEAADLLVTDLKMAPLDGLEVMTRARQAMPELDVIMMTAYATVETAVKAMKEGASITSSNPSPTKSWSWWWRAWPSGGA